MTDDIVTRLRDCGCIVFGGEYVVGSDHNCLLHRAAARIEAQQAEIGRLRRWKAEAMEVIGRWDAIADSIPCQLGQRRSDAVAAEIERLRNGNAGEHETVAQIADDFARFERDPRKDRQTYAMFELSKVLNRYRQTRSRRR